MIKIKSHIKIIFLVCFVLFIINKVYVRPMLEQGELPSIIEVISYSIPNFFEAIMGTSMLVVILLILQSRIVSFLKGIGTRSLKWFGILFSAIYVITQELKIHNLGGRNVYDFNDLIASTVGLLCIGLVIFRYGVVEKP